MYNFGYSVCYFRDNHRYIGLRAQSLSVPREASDFMWLNGENYADNIGAMSFDVPDPTTGAPRCAILFQSTNILTRDCTFTDNTICEVP